MDFEKICMMFTMQEPFYGILLSSMNRIAVPSSCCQTIGVARSGNVFKLCYNPDFINNLDTDTLLEILKHEVLHIALGHLTMWDNEPESNEEHYIRNVAEDLEVNCYININKIRNINPITVDKFGWDKKLGAREYFRRLIEDANKRQKQQNQQASNNVSKPCDNGRDKQKPEQQEQENNNTQENLKQKCNDSSNNEELNKSQSEDNQYQQPQQQISKEYINELNSKGESIDDHSQWPDDIENFEKELINQQIEDMLVFAADEVEKNRGNIPGELAGKIEAIRKKKKPKPVADWKRYMRRYMGNEFSEFIRKSKKRESRRFPDSSGNRHRRKSHILVAIDTSGSVSMPEYQEFFGQIKTLTSVADFHVVECDAMIQYEYDYRGKPNMTLHGGGGTMFEPVVDLFNKDRRKYDALIYFTDGYCSIPKDTPKDTLWVISSKGDQSSRNKYQVNGASVAFIPKEK